MGRRNYKFAGGTVIVLGVLAWLGLTGYEDSKTYYITLPEVRTQGQRAYFQRLRVAGDVLPGSIRRQGGHVYFTLYEGEDRLEVVYTGDETLPDTLVDNAQAIVTGSLGQENTFEAQQVQAKCASKYEALPPGAAPAEPPPASTDAWF